MKLYKHILSILLAAALIPGLTACGSPSAVPAGEAWGEVQIAALVQGNLDEIYLGSVTEEYMRLVNTTQAQGKQVYEDGLAVEAGYFAEYFEIESMDDELEAQIIDLYREIYEHSRYTVGEASRLDDDTYTVAVDVSPINIMALALDSADTALADFRRTYADVDVSEMTDAEYAAYDADWAQAVISMVRAQLPNVGYEENVSLSVPVTRGDDNLWQIDSSGMGDVDAAIIYYP